MNQNEPKQSNNETNVSNRKLWLAVVGAAFVAALLLVTVILPAEFGMDPVGTGRLLGLSQMGESKHLPSNATPVTTTPVLGSTPVQVEEQSSDTSPPSLPEANAHREDRVELVLPPGRGVEVKATMQAGQTMTFSWKTDGASLYFDFHGDEFNAAKDVFTSYLEGNESSQQGTFDATFGGYHGWYWKNKTTEPVRIELTTSGNYDDIRQL